MVKFTPVGCVRRIQRLSRRSQSQAAAITVTRELQSRYCANRMEYPRYARWNSSTVTYQYRCSNGRGCRCMACSDGMMCHDAQYRIIYRESLRSDARCEWGPGPEPAHRRVLFSYRIIMTPRRGLGCLPALPVPVQLGRGVRFNLTPTPLYT